jgi:hypothetical protein
VIGVVIGGVTEMKRIRYDALNLLDSLPSDSSTSLVTAFDKDEQGFSDLGSDSEEMFYFQPDERAAIINEIKRRKLDAAREARINALALLDTPLVVQDVRYFRFYSDCRYLLVDPQPSSTPSSEQLTLMRKLALTLASSDHPALLEIRILTHHRNDIRFDFLRKGGRFSELWPGIRAKRGVEEVVLKRLGGGARLVDYDSDSDEEAEIVEGNEARETTAVDEEERKKREKAERVKEWSRKRKEARES